MNSRTEPVISVAERPLGAMEKVFYLLNQVHPNHFVIVGEVAGATRIDQWQSGLDKVARHSALVWSRIKPDSSGVPMFLPVAQGSIPLKVICDDTSAWTTEVEAQMAEPFDELQPPLLRATLLHGEQRSIVILAAHHSIGDGLSLTFLLGDLLRAVSGLKLVRSQETDAVERLVERRYAEAVGAVPLHTGNVPEIAEVKRKPKEFRQADGSAPHVEALRLTPDMTTRLRDRARAEGTTVQSALGAAFAAAITHLAPNEHLEPLRILSPVDLRRRLLNHSDHLAECASAIVLVDNCPRSHDLWTRARHLALAFVNIQSPATLAGKVLGTDAKLANVNTLAGMKPVIADVFGSEALLTNLGVVNLPREYGPLSLRAIWGPAVGLGFIGEQTIGAATFDNQLHLLHTSFTPIPGLLHQIAVEVSAALTGLCSDGGRGKRARLA